MHVLLNLTLSVTQSLLIATDEQNFKDGTFLYRFTADDGHEGHKDAQRRLTGTPSRIDFNVVSVSTCRTITVSVH